MRAALRLVYYSPTNVILEKTTTKGAHHGIWSNDDSHDKAGA